MFFLFFNMNHNPDKGTAEIRKLLCKRSVKHVVSSSPSPSNFKKSLPIFLRFSKDLIDPQWTISKGFALNSVSLSLLTLLMFVNGLLSTSAQNGVQRKDLKECVLEAIFYLASFEFLLFSWGQLKLTYLIPQIKTKTRFW